MSLVLLSACDFELIQYISNAFSVMLGISWTSPRSMQHVIQVRLLKARKVVFRESNQDRLAGTLKVDGTGRQRYIRGSDRRPRDSLLHASFLWNDSVL